MKVKQKFRRFFFKVLIQYPIGVVLIITLVLASLYYISSTNYTSIYYETKVVAEDVNISGDKNYVDVSIDKKYIDHIKGNNAVLWSTSNSGNRYDGIIRELRITEEKLIANVELFHKNFKKEDVKDIILEIYIKDVKIIDKIMKKEEV